MTPPVLKAHSGEWSHYIAGHDEHDLALLDKPELLWWENVWMRPVTDADVSWSGTAELVECGSLHPDGRPFMAVRHK